MPTFKMRCRECGEIMYVEATPREKATRDYPGAAAHIYAEGCEHAEQWPEEDLWEVFYERFHRRPDD